MKIKKAVLCLVIFFIINVTQLVGQEYYYPPHLVRRMKLIVDSLLGVLESQPASLSIEPVSNLDEGTDASTAAIVRNLLADTFVDRGITVTLNPENADNIDGMILQASISIVANYMILSLSLIDSASTELLSNISSWLRKFDSQAQEATPIDILRPLNDNNNAVLGETAEIAPPLELLPPKTASENGAEALVKLNRTAPVQAAKPSKVFAIDAANALKLEEFPINEVKDGLELEANQTYSFWFETPDIEDDLGIFKQAELYIAQIGISNITNANIQLSHVEKIGGKSQLIKSDSTLVNLDGYFRSVIAAGLYRIDLVVDSTAADYSIFSSIRPVIFDGKLDTTEPRNNDIAGSTELKENVRHEARIFPDADKDFFSFQILNNEANFLKLSASIPLQIKLLNEDGLLVMDYTYKAANNTETRFPLQVGVGKYFAQILIGDTYGIGNYQLELGP